MEKVELSPEFQARMQGMERRAAREFLWETGALLVGQVLVVHGLVALALAFRPMAWILPICAAGMVAAFFGLARKKQAALAASNRQHGLQLQSPGWLGLFASHHFLAFDPHARKLACIHWSGDLDVYDFSDIENWCLDIAGYARSSALRRFISRRLPFLPRFVLLELRLKRKNLPAPAHIPQYRVQDDWPGCMDRFIHGHDVFGPENNRDELHLFRQIPLARAEWWEMRLNQWINQRAPAEDRVQKTYHVQFRNRFFGPDAAPTALPRTGQAGSAP